MAENIQVSYLGLVRNALGVRHELVSISGDMRVRDLVRELWQRHGNAFALNVLNSDGSLRYTSRILLDDRDITDMEGLDTQLEGHTEALVAAIIYPVEGGR